MWVDKRMWGVRNTRSPFGNTDHIDSPKSSHTPIFILSRYRQYISYVLSHKENAKEHSIYFVGEVFKGVAASYQKIGRPVLEIYYHKKT